MKLVDWIPLAVAALSILGAAITYAYQRRVDRSASLLQKRREIYSRYVKELQINIIGIDNKRQYQESYSDIFIFGTDDVILSTSKFHSEIADKAGKIDGQRAAEAYTYMVLSMRKDCFESSKLNVDQIIDFLPFRFR